MKQQDRVVHMANQIARNLETRTDIEAAGAIADHILTFWDPRMRASILDSVDGLEPVAAAAVEIVRQGMPVAHSTPATAFDDLDGIGRSDAG